MSARRRQTMAKATRERTVRERREQKQERKRQRKLEAAERAEAAVDVEPTPAESASGDVE